MRETDLSAHDMFMRYASRALKPSARVLDRWSKKEDVGAEARSSLEVNTIGACAATIFKEAIARSMTSHDLYSGLVQTTFVFAMVMEKYGSPWRVALMRYSQSFVIAPFSHSIADTARSSVRMAVLRRVSCIS